MLERIIIWTDRCCTGIKEDWSTYATHLVYYYEANDIQDPDK